jgi:hypothetical protein
MTLAATGLLALALIAIGELSIEAGTASDSSDLPVSRSPADAQADPPLAWQHDYREAMAAAKAEQKMLLLLFQPTQSVTVTSFEEAIQADPRVQKLLANYVLARLPLNATINEQGKPISLLKHPAFAEMLGRPGLAIIDQRDPKSPHFGRVVSVYPFARDPISMGRLAILLDLPTGTLTQRTMTFAVRAHPEHPESAWSETSQLLTSETDTHARYQASIRLQGHHHWDQRFQQINGQLPSNLVANEVCAESWPGQTLVEAAEECVHCWRQSSGHWDHVRRRHAHFGYDIHRGQNGIWYATGIFASRR